MNRPIISQIIPTARSINEINDCILRWASKISHEMIFIGPEVPQRIKNLPENIRFIKTSVKPAQTLAYGFHIARGELVQFIPDDIIPIPPEISALDTMYQEWIEFSKEYGYKTMLSMSPYTKEIIINGDTIPSYVPVPEEKQEERRKEIIHQCNKIFDSELDDDSFLVPLCGLISKKFYDEIGGPDKRFASGCADLEMYRRMTNAGGRVFFSKIQWHEIKSQGWKSSRWHGLHHFSRIILDQTCLVEKNQSPQLFDMKDILERNQGSFDPPIELVEKYPPEIQRVIMNVCREAKEYWPV